MRFWSSPSHQQQRLLFYSRIIPSLASKHKGMTNANNFVIVALGSALLCN